MNFVCLMGNSLKSNMTSEVSIKLPTPNVPDVNDVNENDAIELHKERLHRTTLRKRGQHHQGSIKHLVSTLCLQNRPGAGGINKFLCRVTLLK